MDNSTPPPPFLTKTYDMVDDSFTNAIVSWSPTCSYSFVVWDFYEFSRALLPRFFKHNNFSSFVRQLNTYGQRHRLKNIHRRRTAPSTTSNSAFAAAVSQAQGFVGVGHMLPQAWTAVRHQPQPVRHAESELEQLREERNVILSELGRLGAQHHSANQQIKCISDRLQAMEMRQQQIVTFVARTMRTPTVVYHQHMGNQAIAVDCSQAVPQKLLEECVDTDPSCNEVRKRRCIMYSERSASENGVLGEDCRDCNSQLQQQYIEEHASSWENNQKTATSVTMMCDNQETAASDDHKLLVELNLENDSNSTISFDNIQGGSNVVHAPTQNLVFQKACNRDVGVASTTVWGMSEDVKMKLKLKMKRPMGEGYALSLESLEHLQMVDLNLQPLNMSVDDFQCLPSGRAGSGVEGRQAASTKCMQTNAANTTCFEDLERERCWEHLVSWPVAMQAEHSVSAPGSVSCFGLNE